MNEYEEGLRKKIIRHYGTPASEIRAEKRSVEPVVNQTIGVF
jgi:hypothetical protein